MMKISNKYPPPRKLDQQNNDKLNAQNLDFNYTI